MSTDTPASFIRESEAKKSNLDRVESLRDRVNRTLDAESLLAQSKALASLISNLADSPHQLEHDEIGWIGAMMVDHLNRLELALALEDAEREDVAPVAAGVDRE